MATILSIGQAPGRVALDALLASAGHKVLGAETAQEALDFVRSGPPELVLLHEPLAGAASAEVVDRLRREPTLDRAPIFVLGADGPLDPEALPDLLARRREAGGEAAEASRYRALFDNSLNGIALHQVWLDEEGAPVDCVFVEVNRAFEALTGLGRGRVRGHRASEVLPGIEETPLIVTLGRVALTGETARFELFVPPLGRRFDVVAFPWQRGQVAAVFDELPAGRQADDEQQLRLQGAALAAAANAIVITDREGRVTWTNPAFTRLTGWPAEEIRGRSTNVLRSGHHPRAFYEELWRTILAGQVWRGEMLNRRKDGSLYHEDQTITPLRDERSGEITHFVAVKLDATEKREAREALLQSERRYRSIAEAAHDQIVIVDRTARVQYLNTAAAAALRLRPEQGAGKRLDELFPADAAAVLAEKVGRVVASGEDVYAEERASGAGRETWIGTWLAPIHDEGGAVEAVVGVSRDLTEQRRLERQLLQAQKLEAIGLLAGGVAHDFNNLLGVVSGHAELALRRLPAGDPLRRNLQAIRRASARAAELARQLLAIGRPEPAVPEVVQVDTIVGGMEDLLRRLIPESIELRSVLRSGAACVRLDRGQLEQVLMNLAVNARDAMPRGGRILIETAEVELDEGYCRRNEGLRPGPHVMLAVTDEGTGMDETTRRRIFEPFFTTKEPGRGTGLGLSTADTIVRRAGGAILVDSELGRGSTFKLLLPRATRDPASRADGRRPALASVRGGSETILLVEDEEALRALTCEVLESFGYTVLPAAGGAAALAASERHAGPLDLVITDMVMPGVSGPELAARLSEARPRTPVLFVSGYAEDSVPAPTGDRVSFLQKPFTSDTLGRRVRELLDGPA